VEEQVCWGDVHLNLRHRDVSRIEQVFAAARAQLDFFPIAYYPCDHHEVALRPGQRHKVVAGCSCQTAGIDSRRRPGA
jgi:hypothetical protein